MQKRNFAWFRTGTRVQTWDLYQSIANYASNPKFEVETIFRKFQILCVSEFNQSIRNPAACWNSNTWLPVGIPTGSHLLEFVHVVFVSKIPPGSYQNRFCTQFAVEWCSSRLFPCDLAQFSEFQRLGGILSRSNSDSPGSISPRRVRKQSVSS